MRKIKISFVMVVMVLVLASIFTMMPVMACNSEHSVDKDLLYVVSAQEDIANIRENDKTSAISDVADFVTTDNFTLNTLNSYSAVALPAEWAQNLDLSSSYKNGVRIYLYGSLSVSDYTTVIKSDLEATRIVTDIGDDPTKKQVTQTIEDNDTRYAVIGWSNSSVADKGLLCKFDAASNEIAPYWYYVAVLDNYRKSLNVEPSSIELIDQKTDYITWYNDMNSSTHLDWYLSQDMGERDTQIDYYGITTNVWATTDASGSEISNVGIIHEAVFSSDEFYDCSPESTSSLTASSISVDLASGTLSASINLSSKPHVTRDTDFTNDIVQWDFTPRTAFPIKLDGDVFKAITVWSTNTSYRL